MRGEDVAIDSDLPIGLRPWASEQARIMEDECADYGGNGFVR